MSDIHFSAVNLSCLRNRKTLFQNFNFLLKSGESLYIKGDNGAGKTSLLRLLAGLGEAEKGDVYWCGQKIRLSAELFSRHRLFIGHQDNLNPLLSPLENVKVSWALEYNAVLSDAQLHHAFHYLAINLKEAPCYTLSVGQRRRVTLSRLLLSQATLWLLDEPFTGLDHSGIHLIKKLMLSHLNRGGIIVYSSHLEQDLHTYVYQL